MQAVREWLAARGHGLVLESDAESCFDPEERVVKIDSTLPREDKIAVALHECGHLLIRRSRERCPKKRIAGATARECDKETGRCKNRTQSGNIATLHEEIEAWERGFHLGRRLSLRFSQKKFDRLRCKCLATYAHVVG